MKKGLTLKFNAKCYKDFKIGKRTKDDGTVNHWQGNKLVASVPPKTSEMKSAGAELLRSDREDKRLKQLRVAPEGIKIQVKPGM